MSQDRHLNYSCHALAGALALAAASALANPVALPTSTPQDSIVVADSSQTAAPTQGSTTPRTYPAIETGVRRAAAEGPEALRRYIWRTRMIYNYYFWDFAKQS